MTEALRKAARELLEALDAWRAAPCKDEQDDRLEDLWDAEQSLRAALSTPEISGQEILDNSTPEPSREDDYAGSMTTCEERGPRLVGPHGGLKRSDLPNPSDADLADPLFEAIWQATKTWDVNAPEYYVGYCGMNGSHVMLIVNAIRAMKSEPSREPTQEQVEKISKMAFDFAESVGKPLNSHAWFSDYDNEFACLAHAAGFEAGRMAGGKDAERWQALLNSARIRVIGTAGFSGNMGAYRHVGLELWNEYPNAGDNTYGKEILIGYADAIAKEPK